MRMSGEESGGGVDGRLNGPSVWRGVFVDSLYRVCQEVHPGTGIETPALEHVEALVGRLLDALLLRQPHSVAEAERAVDAHLPAPINGWAVREAADNARAHHSRRRHAALIHRLLPLLRERLHCRVDEKLALFVVSVLEYVAADILKLTGNYVKNIRSNQITLQDLKVALRADRVLMDLFYRDEEEEEAASGAAPSAAVTVDERELTYEKAARDLLHDEGRYLRRLNLLVHVFRRAFVHAAATPEEVEAVFSNAPELHELTTRFVRSLEDAVELSESASVGAAFWDMAEGSEFDVYAKYAADVADGRAAATVQRLLRQPLFKQRILARGNGFFLAVKYVLPTLLLGPLLHCLEYFDYLNVLERLTDSHADRDDLSNSKSQLLTLAGQLEQRCAALSRDRADLDFLSPPRPAQHLALLKRMIEIERSITGWKGKNVNQRCTTLIREGPLSQVCIGQTDTLRAKSRSLADRYVFLFDSLLVVCKPIAARKSSGTGAAEYKFKEKRFSRLVDLFDRDDADELKHAFELRYPAGRDGCDAPPLLLCARSADEKRSWVASLVYLQTNSMLERMLDSFLKEEERRIPLVLPTPEQYRFAERDNEDNIVFEDYTSSSGIPVVKGGTVVKLVERLTYHLYTDNKYVKTFLTTYRSFCSPAELLELLIERFDIPAPVRPAVALADVPPPPLDFGTPPASPPPADAAAAVWDQSVQRFRKEFANPIQIKVLGVMRQWVVKHWHDFGKNAALLGRLLDFLAGVHSNLLRKCVQSIRLNVERLRAADAADAADEDGYLTRRQNGLMAPTRRPRAGSFGQLRPVAWFIAGPTDAADTFDLLTLHPLEVARQVTLIESELYRAVTPVELLGTAWMKEDKQTRSPQLLRLIDYSTAMTYWLERVVVEAENVDERVAVVQRILEVMSVFDELNNFNGLIEFFSALRSAAVHRLHHTWERLDREWRDVFDALASRIADPHHQYYKKRLRECNPPCVPFFGTYLSTIYFLDHSHPVYFTDADMETDDLPPMADAALHSQRVVSFQKCRKIASVIADIQMYQNEPYALQPEPSIRQFFESLDPWDDIGNGKDELENYLYEQSVKIEPKDCDRPPAFPLRRSAQSLKSPGTKQPKVPASTRHRSTAGAHTASAESPPPVRSADAEFGIIDIRPGQPPRYVADVATAPRLHGRSQPSSPAPAERAPPASAPPLPPRTLPRQRKTTSPRSPLSPPASRRPAPSPSSAAPSAATDFVFPPPPRVRSPPSEAAASTSGGRSPPSVPPRLPPRFLRISSPPPTPPTPSPGAPPLPPRAAAVGAQRSPPPRPPKKPTSVPPEEPPPPPLPPKTYKQKVSSPRQL